MAENWLKNTSRLIAVGALVLLPSVRKVDSFGMPTPSSPEVVIPCKTSRHPLKDKLEDDRDTFKKGLLRNIPFIPIQQIRNPKFCSKEFFHEGKSSRS